MNEFGSTEVKNRFHELLAKAERGEEITITRRGRPIAKLVSAMTEAERRQRSREAAQRIRELAKKIGGKFDWEEWKRYRDDGRR